MRLPKFSKKVMAIGAAVGIAMGAAGVAAAYLTSTGTGTGSLSAGGNVSVTILQTGSVTNLRPNNGFQYVKYTFTNAAGNGNQTFGHVSLTNITVTGAKAANGCKATWFTQTTSATAIGQVNNGAGFTSTTKTEPKIQENTTSPPSNQDSCEGAVVSFTIVAAAGS